MLFWYIAHLYYNEFMNKKILFSTAIVVILVMLVGGTYYWKNGTQKPDTQQVTEDIQRITTGVSDTIVNNISPDLTVPTVAVPETNANPYKETNPFSNLKTNPFQ